MGAGVRPMRRWYGSWKSWVGWGGDMLPVCSIAVGISGVASPWPEGACGLFSLNRGNFVLQIL